MTPDITLSRSLTDPGLFGSTFAAPSFWPWRVIAKLIDGLVLAEPREIELFEQCTGRAYDRQAVRSIRRIILLAGRRAGKDRFESAVAVWRAALCADWRKHISAGEQAVVILLGADKKQALQHTDAVAAATAVLDGLTAKRKVLIESRAADDAERRAVAFEAFSGGEGSRVARKKLDGLSDRAVRFESELRGIEDAIAVAQDKLQAARAAEAQEAAKIRAHEIAKVNDAALEHSVVLSDALHDATMAIDNLKACWDQFGKLGVTAPHQQQLKVNIVNVISGVLSSLPYAFETLHFNFLPRHRRVDVEGLFSKWHVAIRDRYFGRTLAMSRRRQSRTTTYQFPPP